VPDLHDLGGKPEHFGPILRDHEDAVFHAPWERRVFGMTTFLQLLFGLNLDAFRAELERLPTGAYFSPYYARWLSVLERRYAPLADGTESVSRARVAFTVGTVRATMGRATLPRWVNAYVSPRMVGGAKHSRQTPAFAVGDVVRVRPERHSGHTRQPGYVTGRAGTITAHHGAAVFADDHAATGSKAPEHLYEVAFDGAELWGDRAEPNTEVRIELFEPYLEHP
jgi:nitrile hydratase